MDRLTLLSDLKADELRCKIKNINKKGETTFIEVYNILGERRGRLLEELTELLNNSEVNDETFNNFYFNLIIEFTNLVMDVDDVKFLINEGTQVSKVLMQEINDMIYELQYEYAMEQLQVTRNLALGMLSQRMLEEMKYAEDRLNQEKEKRNKIINHKTKKVNRRRVKPSNKRK